MTFYGAKNKHVVKNLTLPAYTIFIHFSEKCSDDVVTEIYEA